MRTIWKFQVDLEHDLDSQSRAEVPMPPEARILHVDHQPATPSTTLTLWAEVDVPSAISAPVADKRAVYVVGTGHPVPDGAEVHIATVQLPPFVWHVYEPHREVAP